MIVNIVMIAAMIFAVGCGFGIGEVSEESDKVQLSLITGFSTGVLIILLVLKAFSIEV